MTREHLQRLHAIHSGEHVIALPQDIAQQLSIGGLVLHDQHTHRITSV